ncbi:MAG: aminotransferase class I/II-fold pyridoxal phosphate-dependent enzyme, partial [Nitrospiraceae bacterium]
MAYGTFKRAMNAQLAEIRSAGLYKAERQLLGPQGAEIRVAAGPGHAPGTVLNLCANTYLGLANHPDVVRAATEGLAHHGYGMASVRFICGTQDLHKRLEQALSTFLGTDETILYSSCFDANTGFFETVLDERDAVISDALNHASLIDGIRLCKAQRFRYGHSDMGELETALKQASACRLRVIATDGVFSMDGHLARLPEIVAVAETVVGPSCRAWASNGPSSRVSHRRLATATMLMVTCLARDRVGRIVSTSLSCRKIGTGRPCASFRLAQGSVKKRSSASK